MSFETDSKESQVESEHGVWPTPVPLVADETCYEAERGEKGGAEQTNVDGTEEQFEPTNVQEIPLDANQPVKEPRDIPPLVLDSRLDVFEQRVVGQLETLRDEFQHKIQYDRVKEKQVSELSRELQSYRSDLLANAMRPLINDVIRLHRKIDKKIVSLAMTGEADDATEELIRSLIDIREDLELALGRQDVEVYRVEGDMADPRLQFVIRPVDTANPDLVGRIINRLAPGYRKGERILEKERIEAYRFNAEAPFGSCTTSDASASARGDEESVMTDKGANA